ncbi:Pre-mRNA cleavage and polyadenylation factor IA/II complex, subunit CLP1 [Anaerohalosphaera lusitana]|uniref:Pre-mRNA cleavage and polyadenylation factor IA/II complex, subunit CLP1 n=2 Tax=Anaerohalosphaera lusitana TaxID=1936003 RepID=A0A1U9NRF7_9BACT|nr:Pre-mRNA cleavage and polyadenylation factor IA/II complex, subunit CLP1 [Anaerohalosphaera lusitana]
MQINELTQKIIAEKPRTILVLGACDTGKTTFTLDLAKRLVQHSPTAILDSDTGQSHIGLPSTIAYANLTPGTTDYQSLTANAPAFIGDVTPTGHLLQFCAALHNCLRSAREHAHTVLIDTPGYISDSTARALWHETYRLIAPDLIIALQKENELEHILASLPKNARITRIIAPSHIPAKTPAARRAYRSNLFRRYFNNARTWTVDLKTTPYQSRSNLTPQNIANRVLALRNYNSHDTALAIAKEYDPRTRQLTILSPATPCSDIAALIFGDFTLEPAAIP